MVGTVTRTSLGERASALARAARPHALPALALVALVLALYHATLAWLLNAWLTNDYYTHGFLVVPLALTLVWLARRKLAAAPARSVRVANAWAVLAGGALYLYGLRLHDPFVLALSLIVLLWGTALLALGWPRARLLIVPAAFLLLAVPIPHLLEIGLAMQRLAADGTARFLGFFGTPMRQDDFTLTAGGMSFIVAPMCSGLSSSISILTLTSFIAAIAPLRPWGRALIITSCVPIALAANILRIALTVWIGLRWGGEAAEGFLHQASSLVLFVLAFAGVLALVLGVARVQRIPLRRLLAHG